MKLNLIRNLLPGFIGLLLLLTLPAATSADPGDRDSQSNAGDLKVELDFATEPVKTGSNDVIVKLYNTAGKPIGGAEVTVMVAELLQVDPASHDKNEDSHSHQAQVGAQPQADTAAHAEVEADSHQPAQPTEHDVAAHAEVEVDSHQPAQPTEHDVADMTAHAEVEVDSPQPAAGHSDGHGKSAPAELIAGPMPGEYKGQVSFTAEGRWLVKVNFSTQSRTKEVEFTVDVVKSGPNWYVLGSFLSVNTLVMATAAVMKQRAAKG